MANFDRAHSPLIGVTNNGTPELLEDLAEYHGRMEKQFLSAAAAQRERARAADTSRSNINARKTAIRAGLELMRAYVQSMDYTTALGHASALTGIEKISLDFHFRKELKARESDLREQRNRRIRQLAQSSMTDIQIAAEVSRAYGKISARQVSRVINTGSKTYLNKR